MGSITGWVFTDNLTIVLVSGFIRQLGMLPNAYVFATMICYAYDSIEQKSGLRLEGLLGVAIIGAIQTAVSAPFAGGYESSILQLGFVDIEKKLPQINAELKARRE